MPLSAGSYRGRIGDRAYFSGLGRVGVSPYAGAGPYNARQVAVAGLGQLPYHRQIRIGATGLPQMRAAWNQSYPQGMQFAGISLGDAPIPHKRVTLPSGHTVTIY